MQTDIHQIDFLPAEYRQQHAKRKHRSWRLFVLAGIVMAVLLAGLAQNGARNRVVGQLAAVEPQHELAERQAKQLADAQNQLRTAQADAELYTYLRHPWPRTQILAAVFTPLPEDLTFQRVEIIQRRRQNEAPAQRRSRNEEKAEEARLAALPPAARTLEQLRAEADSLQTVVTIHGTTTDSASLHHYMAALEKSRLFSNVELSDVESSIGAGPSSDLRFSAMLVVRPGYGQPGGTIGPKQELVAQANSER